MHRASPIARPTSSRSSADRNVSSQPAAGKATTLPRRDAGGAYLQSLSDVIHASPRVAQRAAVDATRTRAVPPLQPQPLRGERVVQRGLWDTITALPNKLVGNNVSDLAIGLTMRGLSNVRRQTPNVPRYGPVTGRGFGTFMEVTLTQSNIGGPPSVTNATWDALSLRADSAGDGSRSYYVRGHLLNQHLGGPGDTWSNLTPVTQQSNHMHVSQVESQVKAAVAELGTGQQVIYRVQAIYGTWPWQWPGYIWNILASNGGKLLLRGAYQGLAALKDAEQHIPVSLRCQWWGPTRNGSVTIQQTRNSGTRFRIRVGPDIVDFSNAETTWNYVQTAAVIGMRTLLLPWLAGVPQLSGWGGTVLMRMTPGHLVDYLIGIAGSRTALVAFFDGSSWELTATLTKFLAANAGKLTDSLLALHSTQLPSYRKPEETRPANREAFRTYRDMPNDARAEYQNIVNDTGTIGSRVRRRNQV